MLINLVHPGCKVSLDELEIGLAGRVFCIKSYTIEDFDDISASQYRRFLPFVLQAIENAAFDFEGSYEVFCFITMPFTSYLSRGGRRPSLLQELQDRSHLQLGWVAETLKDFSIEELKCAIDVSQSILEARGENFCFAKDLKDLIDTMTMVLSQA